MFLNNGILKRLMKQAYKAGGLIVARTEKRTYIAGNFWEMDVLQEFLPKQILAQIIELAGELPGEGERFRADKNGNQMEMVLKKEVDQNGFSEGIEVTNFILLGKQSTAQRVLQTPAGKAYIVNDAFIEIADNAAVAEDRGEYRVGDHPLYNRDGILWRNNVASFHAFWRDDKPHERVLMELERVDLTEDPAE